MAKLVFKDAEVARDAIMASQKKEIENLYKQWADEIGKRITPTRQLPVLWYQQPRCES